jgi:hypothetical protein
MAGNLPPALNQGSTNEQYTRESAPPRRQSARLRNMSTVIALVVTAIIAIAALIVVLTRPVSKPPATFMAPTYSAAEIAVAQGQRSNTYTLVARAVESDNSGNDRGLARIADTNGAVMLDMAAANPVLDGSHHGAARALAAAYETVAAMGTSGVASDAEYRAALDDVIATDGTMKKVCSGG